MIYALIQTYRPGPQRKNFIAAVSGKAFFVSVK
jgi:hypothetical protein